MSATTARRLYDDDTTVVFTNGSGEIFVYLAADPRIVIRITPNATRRQSLNITSSSGTITPSVYNGVPGVAVLGGYIH
jgi:hypothetical protein